MPGASTTLLNACGVGNPVLGLRIHCVPNWGRCGTRQAAFTKTVAGCSGGLATGWRDVSFATVSVGRNHGCGSRNACGGSLSAHTALLQVHDAPCDSVSVDTGLDRCHEHVDAYTDVSSAALCRASGYRGA